MGSTPGADTLKRIGYLLDDHNHSGVFPPLSCPRREEGHWTLDSLNPVGGLFVCLHVLGHAVLLEEDIW